MAEEEDEQQRVGPGLRASVEFGQEFGQESFGKGIGQGGKFAR